MTYSLDTIVAWAKRRGFVYPGSDIYGGLANAWDLGPYGVQLRRNIKNLRRKEFVQKRADVVGLDSQILMNPKVWEASGHVGGFSDPLIDCKKCNNRFRADKIIEEKIYKDNITVEDLKEKLGVDNLIPESREFEKQRAFFDIFEIPCKRCGAKDWTDVRSFNLMYKTKQGVMQDNSADIYLRPETAQGIFVNFKNIVNTMRVRLPFGIAQIGKAFRNEITPGNFLFRVREFEQMEIEFFIEPGEDNVKERMHHWKEESLRRRKDLLGIRDERLRLRDHEDDELSHYSTGTTDIEYEFPRGRGELQATGASRTDFDLKQHMEHSGKDMQYTDPYTGKRFIPFVVEPSRGLTRSILTVMLDAYQEESYTDGNGKEAKRTVAKFHKNIAPVHFAILPLIKKDEDQVKIAKEIFAKLSVDYVCEYDDGGAIGKRYRRQDEIGTPYCITVDHQSVEDGTVTVRDRDSMEQKRVKIEEIKY